MADPYRCEMIAVGVSLFLGGTKPHRGLWVAICEPLGLANGSFRGIGS